MPKIAFHINSGLIGLEDRLSQEEVAERYQGHEVSAHTVTHPTLARCPKEQIVDEIFLDRINLERIVEYRDC